MTWRRAAWWRCFLLRRLRNASKLGGAELRLSLRAIVWLAVARVALPVLGFPRIRRWLDTIQPAPAAGADVPTAVRRAVNRAARTIPGSDCLPQAVVAYGLLRASGAPAALTIGVRRDVRGPGPLDAHAWVSSGTLVVTGDSGGTDVASFTELARFRNVG